MEYKLVFRDNRAAFAVEGGIQSYYRAAYGKNDPKKLNSYKFNRKDKSITTSDPNVLTDLERIAKKKGKKYDLKTV